MIKGREVLLLGSGNGAVRHHRALEQYIEQHHPFVMAINTQSTITCGLIDVRVACHPIRLLADCEVHSRLPQPLIVPTSLLTENVKQSLTGKTILDFGLTIEANTFAFHHSHCITPTSLVVAYALAIATSGEACRVLMAGFDGYDADDLRNREMHDLLDLYQSTPESIPLTAITPTSYALHKKSIYGL